MTPEEKTVYEFLKLFLPEDHISVGNRTTRYSHELETDELSFEVSIQGVKDNSDYCFVSGTCKTLSEACEKVLSKFYESRFKDEAIPDELKPF